MVKTETTEQQTDFRIPNPSPELLVKAICSFPLTPRSAGIELIATGTNTPATPDYFENYTKNCLERGVLPGSAVHWRYYPGAGCFLPDNIETGRLDNFKALGLAGLLRHGIRIRRHVLRFSGAEAFQRFKMELHLFGDAGYEPCEGELRELYDSAYEQPVQGWVRFVPEGLNLNAENPGGIPSKVPPYQHEVSRVNILKHWFESLKGNEKKSQG